jgi:predicted transcriptional regulator
MGAMSLEHTTELFGAGTGQETNSTRERAMELLGRGVRPSVVATILRVTPAVISQYQEDPEFKEILQGRLVESQLAASVRDARLDALEDQIITQVERSIQWFSKPADALGALKLINGLARRAPVIATNPDDISTQTVILQLPTHMQNSVVNIQVNTNNEVVEVNGREMRTMATSQVLRELEVSQAITSQNLERENEQRAIASSSIKDTSTLPD